jgi:hypothetical protein
MWANMSGVFRPFSKISAPPKLPQNVFGKAEAAPELGLRPSSHFSGAPEYACTFLRFL